MLKRLQVLLDEDDLREIQAVARRHRLTTAAWVRRTLRDSIKRDGGPDARSKLQAIRAATGLAFPVDDIDEMLAQIERGYVVERGDVVPGAQKEAR